jgi:hypothetical protein
MAKSKISYNSEEKHLHSIQICFQKLSKNVWKFTKFLKLFRIFNSKTDFFINFKILFQTAIQIRMIIPFRYH